MNETLTGRTTREIVFHDSSKKNFIFGARKPAGTEVYVTALRNGTLRIRVPHTLLTQDVYASAIDIP